MNNEVENIQFYVLHLLASLQPEIWISQANAVPYQVLVPRLCQAQQNSICRQVVLFIIKLVSTFSLRLHAYIVIKEMEILAMTFTI